MVLLHMKALWAIIAVSVIKDVHHYVMLGKLMLG